MEKIKNKTKWRKGERRHCEIWRIEFPKGSSVTTTFHLTTRGAKELRRRNRVEKIEQARIKRYNRRYCGLPLKHLLFGPFKPDGSPVFS